MGIVVSMGDCVELPKMFACLMIMGDSFLVRHGLPVNNTRDQDFLAIFVEGKALNGCDAAIRPMLDLPAIWVDVALFKKARCFAKVMRFRSPASRLVLALFAQVLGLVAFWHLLFACDVINLVQVEMLAGMPLELRYGPHQPIAHVRIGNVDFGVAVYKLHHLRTGFLVSVQCL